MIAAVSATADNKQQTDAGGRNLHGVESTQSFTVDSWARISAVTPMPNAASSVHELATCRLNMG